MHTIKNILWDYKNGDGGFLIIKNVVTIEFDKKTNEPHFKREIEPQDTGAIRIFNTEREAALRCFYAAVQDDAMLAQDWFEMVREWGIDVSAENWREQMDTCKTAEPILWDLKFTRVLFRACLGKRASAFLETDPATLGIWRQQK